MGRRLGRPKAGQELLTRESILGAALRLVDEQGMAALSMRRLAAELGVDPMALYHHLPGKAAVIAGLVELVFAELRVPPAGGAGEDRPWPERVRAFARAYRDLARAHPHFVLHLVTHAEAGAAAALEASEALYAALAVAGLPPRLIVRAADLVVDYVNGVALAEVARPLGERGDRRELLALLREQPDAHAPTLRRVLDDLTEDDLRLDFEFGLDTLLAGLATITGDGAPA
jgi:AcrR family transcriptional regulator